METSASVCESPLSTTFPSIHPHAPRSNSKASPSTRARPSRGSAHDPSTAPVSGQQPAMVTAPGSASTLSDISNRPGLARAPSSAGGPKSVASCRLLWRGRLLTERGQPLNGLAIVAHLFTPTLNAHSPALASQSSASRAALAQSPFEDPFSPFASTSVSDLCLGLEMLRGADLRVCSLTRVKKPSPFAAVDSSPAIATEESEEVEVECPTDVRMYVDRRCAESVLWLEETFCRAGGENAGVKVEMGGEEIILFSRLPELSGEPSGSRPSLELLVGRAVRRKVRKPRPDDPMPRENLFASKLRRHASLPVLSFAPDPLRPPSRSSSSRQLGTLGRPRLPKLKPSGSRALLGMLEEEAETGSTLSSTSKGKEVPPPRAFKRSLSTTSSRGGSLFSTSATNALESLEAAKARRPVPGVKKRRTLSAVLVDSDEEEERQFGACVPGSPTPSVATVFGGEEDDPLLRRSSTSLLVPPPTRNRGRRGSGSSVVGGSSVAGSSRSRAPSREPSAAPPEPDSIESRNRAAVRKITLARMIARGVGREDDMFKDVFAMTSKGVQFALRPNWSLLAVDKQLASEVADRHLEMYLPGTQLVVKDEEELKGVLGVGVKREEREMVGIERIQGGLPSPRSLEARATPEGEL